MCIHYASKNYLYTMIINFIVYHEDQHTPVVHCQSDVLGPILWRDLRVLVTEVNLLASGAWHTEWHVCPSQVQILHLLDAHEPGHEVLVHFGQVAHCQTHASQLLPHGLSQINAQRTAATDCNTNHDTCKELYKSAAVTLAAFTGIPISFTS